jgi:hypothetical protein
LVYHTTLQIEIARKRQNHPNQQNVVVERAQKDHIYKGYLDDTIASRKPSMMDVLNEGVAGGRQHAHAAHQKLSEQRKEIALKRQHHTLPTNCCSKTSSQTVILIKAIWTIR